jgi:hypothetical protein
VRAAELAGSHPLSCPSCHRGSGQCDDLARLFIERTKGLCQLARAFAAHRPHAGVTVAAQPYKAASCSAPSTSTAISRPMLRCSAKK